MSWDSEQYLKFADERNQPCFDLIHRLNKNYKHILDLRCGPANSTVQIKNIFPEADIIGFDADENMLKKAAADNPDINFVKGYAPDDLCSLGGEFDLIFSNACIH